MAISSRDNGVSSYMRIKSNLYRRFAPALRERTKLRVCSWCIWGKKKGEPNDSAPFHQDIPMRKRQQHRAPRPEEKREVNRRKKEEKLSNARCSRKRRRKKGQDNAARSARPISKKKGCPWEPKKGGVTGPPASFSGKRARPTIGTGRRKRSPRQREKEAAP